MKKSYYKFEKDIKKKRELITRAFSQLPDEKKWDILVSQLLQSQRSAKSFIVQVY